MRIEADGNGVTAVFLDGALAAFGDAGAAPGRLPADQLAGLAAGWFGTRHGRALPVLYADQRHTNLTFVYGREGKLAAEPSLVGICDAVVTDEPGVVLQVRTADCLPVALAGRGVIAMVHAGWRGLAGDILAAAVARFRADFGVPPREVEAVVGVGIGPCHYQVGSEVLAALARRETTEAHWRRGDTVDLGAFAKGRLEWLGVPAGSIVRLPGCTACSPVFYSYRRDGAAAGRQWSAIIREP